MAIKKEIVENKIAVCYHGITVYHTHRGRLRKLAQRLHLFAGPLWQRKRCV